MNREDEGYIPPLAASPIPPPPHHMTAESQYVTVFFDADPEALAHEVPEPLAFAADADGPAASVSIGDARSPPKNMAHYHEAIVRIRVRFEGQEGWYIPYIWVSNEESLFNGRVNGWPKVLCDDDPLQFEGNEINGELNRRDQPIMRVRFNPTSSPREADAVAAEMGALRGDVPALQLKKVQSPVPDGKVLRQVVRSETGDFDVEEMFAGRASVELFDHGSYPNLARLAPTEIRGAFFYRPDFLLSNEGAEIVWESFE
jgi:acetoacetate decarboxylase